jgi:hypothetical protein
MSPTKPGTNYQCFEVRKKVPTVVAKELDKPEGTGVCRQREEAV